MSSYDTPWFARFVPADRVPPKHRQYAQRHVDRLARMHRLGKVRIRWFMPGTPEDHDFGGFGNGTVPDGSCPTEPTDYICLRADRRGDRDLLPLTIAHEIGHMVQLTRGVPRGDPEAVARQFAVAYSRVMFRG